MRTTIKCVISVVCAILIVASAAVGVSADYVTMLDHGFGYTQGYSKYDYIIYVGAGNSLSQPRTLVSFWALDSFDQDTTYTCTFECSYSSTSSFTFKDSLKSYFTTSKLSSTPDYEVSPTAYTNAEISNGRLKITVKFNTTLMDLQSFPLYVTALIPLELTNGNIIMSSNQWATSCEYDPGGSKFLEEYLADIKDQLHKGEGYPTPDGTTLDSSVSSINSAESALTGASSSLMDSVSSEWTANKNTAKTFLTTITPTANEIKNVYTTLTAAMPDEVLALFAIIPLILFIGYLIGRVR